MSIEDHITNPNEPRYEPTLPDRVSIEDHITNPDKPRYEPTLPDRVSIEDHITNPDKPKFQPTLPDRASIEDHITNPDEPRYAQGDASLYTAKCRKKWQRSGFCLNKEICLTVILFLPLSRQLKTTSQTWMNQDVNLLYHIIPEF
jgi:hypothetical protein